MAFEKYVKSTRIYRPYASIWSRGQIGLNQGAVERFKMKDYKFAVLFFDKDTERIGIKLTNNENEEGATTAIKGNTGIIISAASFLEHYNIDHKTLRKYPIDFDQKEELYIIDLKEEFTKKKSR